MIKNKFFQFAVCLLSIIAVSIPMKSQQIPKNLSKYSETIDRILKAATQNDSAWQRLAEMCDTYGNRLSGSENLEHALDWIYEHMKLDGLQNVRKEEVMVPNWRRGHEYCELVSPRKEKIEMLGLGGSIATPPEGITAEVIVVKSFEELKERAKEAKGKIVLYNAPYKGYGFNVQFRWWGAIRAEEVGAVASLVRSVTPHAMSNPHTGGMAPYSDTLPKTPHAAIIPEWADILERMIKRGQKPIVHLYMEAKFLPDTKSANVMGEIEGTDKKDEIIAVGGHSDSWDVGSGAQDDASGCIAAWEAVKLLKNLGIKTRRTIRAVSWVNEENGQMGGKDYAERHKNEKHALLFEFDSGVFPPSAIGFSAKDSSLYDIVKSFEPLLQKIDSIVVHKGGGGTDIGPMMEQGVPGMGLNTRDGGKYFWYHHTPADTPDKVDANDLNKCIAAIAATIFLYSEIIP